MFDHADKLFIQKLEPVQEIGKLKISDTWKYERITQENMVLINKKKKLAINWIFPFQHATESK